MGDNINKLLKEISNQQYDTYNKTHNREIPRELWKKLKSKRECDGCHQKFNEPLYIHHRIPVANGGSNEESNLMVVCWSCHEKEDKKNKTPRTPKQHFSWWKK